MYLASVCAQLRPTLCDPMDHHAPLSMGFPRQGHLSGLPFSPPGDIPHSGIKSKSPALAGRFFTTLPPGKILTARK